MSELAQAGWALLLAEELPQIIAQLALAMGTTPREVLWRLTPTEAAMLFQELGRRERRGENEEALGESPSRDAAMLARMLGD
jgi:hypothetical protein